MNYDSAMWILVHNLVTAVGLSREWHNRAMATDALAFRTPAPARVLLNSNEFAIGWDPGYEVLPF